MTTVIQFKRPSKTPAAPFMTQIPSVFVDDSLIEKGLRDLAAKMAFNSLGIEGLSDSDRLLLAIVEGTENANLSA